jgi:hypothetical protein
MSSQNQGQMLSKQVTKWKSGEEASLRAQEVADHRRASISADRWTTYMFLNVLSDVKNEALNKQQHPSSRQTVVVNPRAVGLQYIGVRPHR